MKMDLVRQFTCILSLTLLAPMAHFVHAEEIGESILVNPGWIVRPNIADITVGKLVLTENNPIDTTPGGTYGVSESDGPTVQRFSPYTDDNRILLEGTPEGLALTPVGHFENAMEGVGLMNTVFDGPELKVNGADFLSRSIQIVPTTQVAEADVADETEAVVSQTLLASDHSFLLATSPQQVVTIYKPWEVNDRTSAEQVYANDVTVTVGDQPIVFDKARLVASARKLDNNEIPEPSTWLAMLVGLMTLTYIRRVKR
ncbi:MAG: PEP-CTERM sorting domain-containing protein [Planctomycetia bacterium]|nr:PEP-CTERM sorting domain-containing protein [Planctomycetia bacterium]